MRHMQGIKSARRRLISRAITVSAAAASLVLAMPSVQAQPGAPAAPGRAVVSNELARLANLTPNRPLPQGAASRPTSGVGSVERGPNGEVAVEAQLRDTAGATLAALNRAGAQLVAVDDEQALASLLVPVDRIDDLAGLGSVLTLREILQPASLAACPTGVVSEGVTQLRANLAHASGYTGATVTIGVISDSYNARGTAPTAPTDVSNAELPGTTNPCGYTSPVGVLQEGTQSRTDEGRAMAQIVHDIAPGAKILFSTASGGQVAMAQQIRNLAANGATIIVDDILYPNEPMYQDGVIAKAITDVTAAGVLYFSAAGNYNAFEPGTNRSVGSYEAPAFRPTNCPTVIRTRYASWNPNITCHDFNPGAGVDVTYGLRIDGGYTYVLGWNEPSYGVRTDLDFCLLDQATGTVYTCGDDDAIAYQTAFDYTSGSAFRQFDLVVIKANTTSANPRFRLISLGSDITDAEYDLSSGGDIVGPTGYAHNVSRSAISVGAVPYNNAAAIESFSARGPALTCWGPVVGSTPAASIPCVSSTIDLLGTDGTRNSFFGSYVGGVYRFYGTSAAAPHAAAVAALVLEKASCATSAQVLAALTSTATPLAGYPTDAQGRGLVNAKAAVDSVRSCRAKYTPMSPVRVLDTRNGTGTTIRRIGPGQSVTFTLPASVPATATAVVLNVTGVQPTASTYLTVHPGGTARPLASNVNLNPLEVLPNLVTVGISSSRTVTIFNAQGNVDIVADLQGYYATGSTSGATLIAPTRVIDTRNGVGGRRAALGPKQAVTFTIPGLPAGTTAVMLNVTGIQPTVGTYVSVYPAGTALPQVSNLNLSGGTVRANAAIVRVGAGNTVTFFNDSGNVHIAADLLGYYYTGGGASFVPRNPDRVVETRNLSGPTPGRIGERQSRTWRVPAIPSTSTGVVLNVTSVMGSTGSFLSVYPGGTAFANTSTINFSANQVVPNMVPTKVGSGGTVTYYNALGTVDVVADLAGWFVP